MKYTLSILSPFSLAFATCQSHLHHVWPFELLILHNFFKFGDTFWQQLTGTAMSALPAPTYAMLYFGMHKLNLLPAFHHYLLFYICFIEDCFGVWLHDTLNPATDQCNGITFQQQINSLGKLTFNFQPHTCHAQFIDLGIAITPMGLTTKLDEKPWNLYQYIRSYFVHAPGISKSFINLLIMCIFHLMTIMSNQKHSLDHLFACLAAHEYPDSFFCPSSRATISNIAKKHCFQPHPHDNDK